MSGEGLELPSLSDLEVPELKLTAVPLLASAIHLGTFCDNKCKVIYYNTDFKEFMLCTYETQDPRSCIKEGKAVTSCAFEFFRKVKKSCASEFESYYKCLHRHGGPAFDIYKCRKMQLPFDDCIKEHLGQERPPPNYFNRVRLHKTERPRHEPGIAPMPERLPDVPDFRENQNPEGMGKRKLLDEILM